jgi:hypothetical protein
MNSAASRAASDDSDPLYAMRRFLIAMLFAFREIKAASK